METSPVTARCPGCKAQLPQEYLQSPVMGCPRCKRVIHWPDFRTPIPPVFDRFDRAARRAAVRLTREWDRATDKKRREIENKLKGLSLVLESS